MTSSDLHYYDPFKALVAPRLIVWVSPESLFRMGFSK